MKPMTEAHLAILRRHMVEVVDMHFDLAEQEIGRDSLSPALRSAMLKVPRHLFVPAQLMVVSYQDTPIPIGFDKTLSQPFIGAVMLELLQVGPGQKALEVGTGLGWQAAVMAEMGVDLFSVEIVEEFAQAARLRLAALDYEVEIRVGDGSRGWSDHAPFDKVLVTAAADWPPQPLVDQLAVGGRMVMPLGGKDVQQLTVLEKQADGNLEAKPVMPVRFTQLETA
ncbi:MAG TPA: protein-L-isoaspartate O-methyltransferase [Allosphingosinicella sp.]|jgi:protein-L-isoaspartate(D-aspartate) O-methyltransferase